MPVVDTVYSKRGEQTQNRIIKAQYVKWLKDKGQNSEILLRQARKRRDRWSLKYFRRNMVTYLGIEGGRSSDSLLFPMS